jgi:NAD(P)-dependent dehydrogenase (short-subunit alcohol dehydrogenase family)
MSRTKNQHTMQDPRSQYPAPPFDKQPQPKPGLTDEMEPRPDHGEDSYVGASRLEGRKALITGGDSGIGRAVAIAFAREGAEVSINFLPSEEPDAESLRDLISGEGGTVHLFPGDVKDESYCRALVQDARGAMDGLDILVVNAAKQVRQDGIEKISSEQFDATMKANVYALFHMTQEAMEVMPAGASIITVASTQAYSPAPHLLDYATTKYAIRGFTQALAQGALDRGIRVNGVAPGPVWTPLQPSGGQSQEKVQSFGEKTPMGRPGQPAEVAPAFVYLASQESSYVAGQIIGVTGGKPTS